MRGCSLCLMAIGLALMVVVLIAVFSSNTHAFAQPQSVVQLGSGTILSGQCVAPYDVPIFTRPFSDTNPQGFKVTCETK